MRIKQLISRPLLCLCLGAGLLTTACKKDENKAMPVTNPIELKFLSIERLKELSTGASVTLGEKNIAYRIKGTIVSDRVAKNIDAKTVVLQEATDKPAIIINFAAVHNLALGDEVVVGVSNQKLEQVNGEIVLNNLPVDSAKKVGIGKIDPKSTTIAELKSNKTIWNGMLVTISATDFKGKADIYEGSMSVKDGSGELTSQVSPSASFAGDLYPASVKSVTGIVRVTGDNVRLDIRNANDIIMGANVRVLTDNFENYIPFVSDPNRKLESVLNSSFETSIGKWDQFYNGPRSPSYYLPTSAGQAPDAGFLNPGRGYVYLPYTTSATVTTRQNAIYVQYDAKVDLKGAKSVTVTFAGSKRNTHRLEYYQFDPATFTTILFKEDVPIGNFVDNSADYIQIGIVPSGAIAGQPLFTTGNADNALEFTLSPKFNKAGEFYTFTFNIPTKQELLNLGVPEFDADRFIAHPVIGIGNLSKRASSTDYAPVIIEKIVYNF